MNEEAADEDLIREALDGRDRAFEILFRRHHPRVYRTVYGIIGGEDEAKDVAQESWLKAWKNLNRYNFQSAFTTWLHRIAVNTAIDSLRRRKRQMSRFRSFFSKTATPEESINQEASDAHDPAKLLGLSEMNHDIHLAITALPEPQRIVFVLREIEGYSYRQIADIENCKIGTVMSRLHLAREKLQLLLKSTEL